MKTATTTQKKISVVPPKGFYDWDPTEFQIRSAIFDKWRKVCTSYGYQEYMTPTLEYADLYKAKSGEDLGGKELMILTDRAGRELALRPEMTPSVTRLVAKIGSSMPKPIRLFSIANFFRNEKPQKGRNREFWQLNIDIFGSEALEADMEILQIALDIMLSYNAPAGAFTLYMNDRRILNEILSALGKFDDGQRSQIMKAMDKAPKMGEDVVKDWLREIGLDQSQIDKLMDILSMEDGDIADILPEMRDSAALAELTKIRETLATLGYGDYVQFKPSIVRGIDYYDGLVFEVFDNKPDFNRALFGGGRYNGLASIFGAQSIPAVGVAPGDEPARIFLENWGLVDTILEGKIREKYMLLNLGGVAEADRLRLATSLRKSGKIVLLDPNKRKVSKAFAYAENQGCRYAVIYGEREQNEGKYKVKDLTTGDELVYEVKE